MRQICVGLMLSALFGCAAASTDAGYGNITEIKSWSTKNDIYLTAPHVCTGADELRYDMPKTDNQQYALLVAALMGGKLVNLNYDCDTDGYPRINSVRVK